MAGPLAKLKVLDFTTLLPGPFASMILADLGASVLRVEAPRRPDMVREMNSVLGLFPPLMPQSTVPNAVFPLI